MNEEALRTVLLDVLNTQYRGQGTAEAFNVEGKTPSWSATKATISSLASASLVGPEELHRRP
jgi:hypothetical protein